MLCYKFVKNLAILGHRRSDEELALELLAYSESDDAPVFPLLGSKSSKKKLASGGRTAAVPGMFKLLFKLWCV